jgi:hypothetical protein
MASHCVYCGHCCRRIVIELASNAHPLDWENPDPAPMYNLEESEIDNEIKESGACRSFMAAWRKALLDDFITHLIRSPVIYGRRRADDD